MILNDKFYLDTLNTFFKMFMFYSNLRPITMHKHFCEFFYVCNATFAVITVVVSNDQNLVSLTRKKNDY